MKPPDLRNILESHYSSDTEAQRPDVTLRSHGQHLAPYACFSH